MATYIDVNRVAAGYAGLITDPGTGTLGFTITYTHICTNACAYRYTQAGIPSATRDTASILHRSNGEITANVHIHIRRRQVGTTDIGICTTGDSQSFSRTDRSEERRVG